MQKAHGMHGRASVGDSLVGKQTNPPFGCYCSFRKRKPIREALLSWLKTKEICIVS